MTRYHLTEKLNGAIITSRDVPTLPGAIEEAADIIHTASVKARSVQALANADTLYRTLARFVLDCGNGLCLTLADGHTITIERYTPYVVIEQSPHGRTVYGRAKKGDAVALAYQISGGNPLIEDFARQPSVNGLSVLITPATSITIEMES